MQQQVQLGLRVGGHQVVGGIQSPPELIDVSDLVEGAGPVVDLETKVHAKVGNHGEGP